MLRAVSLAKWTPAVWGEEEKAGVKNCILTARIPSRDITESSRWSEQHIALHTSSHTKRVEEGKNKGKKPVLKCYKKNTKAINVTHAGDQ